MARLYANENFPLPVVEELRRLGHDVLTTKDSGQGGRAIPDNEVLSFAISEERILVTLNRKHFIRLHHEKPEHTGIIVCTFDLNFQALAQRIDSAVSSRIQINGQLIRINRPT